MCVSTAAEEDQWQTVARTDHGPMREYSVSYQNLMPSSSYIFRVTAYNRFGISYPVSTQEPVGRFRPLLRRCFAFLTVVGSPVGAVPDAEQVVLGVQLSAPEALLPPDVVPGDAGRRFRRHHHPPRRRPLRQEQELQIQTSVTVFFYRVIPTVFWTCTWSSNMADQTLAGMPLGDLEDDYRIPGRATNVMERSCQTKAES